MPDEEAQIKIEVYVNGGTTPLTYGTISQPIPSTSRYASNIPIGGTVDTYIFKLYVWVPTTVPGIFTWQLMALSPPPDELPTPRPEQTSRGLCHRDLLAGFRPEYPWLPAPGPFTNGHLQQE